MNFLKSTLDCHDQAGEGLKAMSLTTGGGRSTHSGPVSKGIILVSQTKVQFPEHKTCK
jgi:hypothetical protein